MFKYLKLVTAFTGVAAAVIAIVCAWLIGAHMKTVYLPNWDYAFWFGGTAVQALALLVTCNLISSTLEAMEAEWAMQQTREMIDTAVNLRKAAAKKEKQDEKAD